MFKIISYTCSKSGCLVEGCRFKAKKKIFSYEKRGVNFRHFPHSVSTIGHDNELLLCFINYFIAIVLFLFSNFRWNPMYQRPKSPYELRMCHTGLNFLT